MMSSVELLASIFPSGENANPSIRPRLCSLRVENFRPVSASQSRRMPSQCPLAKISPSGENASVLIAFGLYQGSMLINPNF